METAPPLGAVPKGRMWWGLDLRELGQRQRRTQPLGSWTAGSSLVGCERDQKSKPPIHQTNAAHRQNSTNDPALSISSGFVGGRVDAAATAPAPQAIQGA